MTHYSPLIAAFVTLLLSTILLYSKAGINIQDVPNERSLHDTPVPRIGGIGLMAGILSSWALMIKMLAWWLVLPMLLLFVISLLDDVNGMSVRKRMLAHVIAAVVMVAGSGLLVQSPAIGLLLIVLTVWMTNLYNFMDGSDGLAGGMALCGFTVYGIAALMHGNDTLAMLCFSIGAASLGFLYYNFPPARMFMGDAGSIPLGFLVAGMGLWGWQQGLWAWWFPAWVFSPFIVDSTVTLIKRSLRQEKITEAHRSHYYQRLIQMGWAHRKVAIAEYLLMAAAGTTSLWALNSASFPWQLLLGWCVLYSLLMWRIDSRWKRFQQESHREN